MNLPNRYLHAVAKCLPRAGREDIIAELRVNILSQMEDRERETGYPLTEDQKADILRQHGNPTVIAGRHSTHILGLAFGKQLIGPELFPFYKTILLINLAITVCILAAIMPVVALTTGSTLTLSRVLITLCAQFGIITAVFMLVDRNKEQLLDNWDPRRLPPIKEDREEGPKSKTVFTFLINCMATL